jgi:hypothetical protein
MVYRLDRIMRSGMTVGRSYHGIRKKLKWLCQLKLIYDYSRGQADPTNLQTLFFYTP